VKEENEAPESSLLDKGKEVLLFENLIKGYSYWCR